MGVLSNLGAVHRIEVAKLAAVPVLPISTSGPQRLTLAGEMGCLEELGLKIAMRGTALESALFPWANTSLNSEDRCRQRFGLLGQSAILTRILLDRFRQENMVSWNQIEAGNIQEPFTIFNGQVFSGHGFSRLAPITRWVKGDPKPKLCPVVFDCYAHSGTVDHVASFLERIERATFRNGKKLPALGVIAAKDFDTDAWKLARDSQLMTVNLRQAFGESALEAMIAVEKIMRDVPNTSNFELSEAFGHVVEQIADLKNNPIVDAIRSIGLEILAGLLLRSQGYEKVELGRKVPWERTHRDIDAYGSRGDDLFIVECKAYHGRKSIEPDDVRKFFTQTVPALKTALRSQGRDFIRCKAQIWTTGLKGDDAGDALFKLGRPACDEWDIVRTNDPEFSAAIPQDVRDHSVRLMKNIAVLNGALDGV